MSIRMCLYNYYSLFSLMCHYFSIIITFFHILGCFFEKFTHYYFGLLNNNISIGIKNWYVFCLLYNNPLNTIIYQKVITPIKTPVLSSLMIYQHDILNSHYFHHKLRQKHNFLLYYFIDSIFNYRKLKYLSEMQIKYRYDDSSNNKHFVYLLIVFIYHFIQLFI